MLEVNKFVIYKRDVCKIIDIKDINNNKYYVLKSTLDDSLIINIPIDNKNNLIRPIHKKEDIDNLINKIKEIKPIDLDTKNIEEEYKKCLQDESLESLVKIIKTSYLRNQNRLENKRKLADRDKYYFDLAEKFLYNEISYVYNMSYDNVKTYIKKILS